MDQSHAVRLSAQQIRAEQGARYARREPEAAQKRHTGVQAFRGAAKARGYNLYDVARPEQCLGPQLRFAQRRIFKMAPPKNPSTLSRSMMSATPPRVLSKLRSSSGDCSYTVCLTASDESMRPRPRKLKKVLKS